MVSSYNHEQKQLQVHVATLAQMKKERNTAYFYCFLIVICCLCLSVVLVVLAKIHTVVPVIAVVDAHGHVIKQSTVSSEKMMADERVVESEIYNFITYCNTYDVAWRQHYADVCRLHASDDIAKHYTNEITQKNNNNPYQGLDKNSRIYPQINGIHRIAEQQYEVAYQLITEKSGQVIKTDYFRAFIQYVFTGQPLVLGDRWENALGFAVTNYRKERELNLSKERS